MTEQPQSLGDALRMLHNQKLAREVLDDIAGMEEGADIANGVTRVGLVERLTAALGRLVESATAGHAEDCQACEGRRDVERCQLCRDIARGVRGPVLRWPGLLGRRRTGT